MISKKSTRFAYGSESAAIGILLALVVSAQVGRAQQKSFPSASDAVKALVDAARADDASALLGILGPEGKELVSSGDEIADKNDRESFVKAYGERHRLTVAGAGKYSLTVGASGWQLPIPIVKEASGWRFDTAAGKEEMLYRRIGGNELDAIRVCRAIIAAERGYARVGHDGNSQGVFTKKLLSDPGKENGLYWEAQGGEAESPGGPLLAYASGDGYELGQGKHQPFHGYLYRILSAQGEHAHGGARDYVVDGKMTRGFAVVAYPAEYRSSGVMTFIVNQHGTVYQKDLGQDTAVAAKGMASFDPDASWRVVR